MVYHPVLKKGYPQVKSTLSTYKHTPLPESVQQTGRRKRSNSQLGSHNKRPKSSKNISGGRKYKAVNQNNISTDVKLSSINQSIEQPSIIPNERPSSVLESIRYSKKIARGNKRAPNDINRETITSSIDVPSIEIQNQEGGFSKIRNQSNHMIYQKAAELIANNFQKNISKIPTQGVASNSQKILRSTSRGGKNKKPKEQTHRKSKSDAKKIAQEMFKSSNNKNYKTNPKLKNSSYIEQVLNRKVYINAGQNISEKDVQINSMPQAYLLNHVNQNWIDSINQQIEENGKSLLESINRAKKKNAQNISTLTKKRKSKQDRPQSTNYTNIVPAQNTSDAFRSILNKRFGSEYIGVKNGIDQENIALLDVQGSHHNKSLNYENFGIRRKEMDPDLTEAQITLNHK